MMAPLINRWKHFVFSWIKLFYRRSEVVFVFDIFVPSPSSQMKNSSRLNSASWVSRSTLSTFPASRYVERPERGEAERRGAMERWRDEQKTRTADNRNTDQILHRDPSGKLHQKNQRGFLWCLITCTWKGGKQEVRQEAESLKRGRGAHLRLRHTWGSSRGGLCFVIIHHSVSLKPFQNTETVEKTKYVF